MKEKATGQYDVWVCILIFISQFSCMPLFQEKPPMEGIDLQEKFWQAPEGEHILVITGD